MVLQDSNVFGEKPRSAETISAFLRHHCSNLTIVWQGATNQTYPTPYGYHCMNDKSRFEALLHPATFKKTTANHLGYYQSQARALAVIPRFSSR
jgi:hypothetical protein